MCNMPPPPGTGGCGRFVSANPCRRQSRGAPSESQAPFEVSVPSPPGSQNPMLCLMRQDDIRDILLGL
ncbi:hypothetical protein BDV98DRAFT_568628, partial [Pterulicium gracile]